MTQAKLLKENEETSSHWISCCKMQKKQSSSKESDGGEKQRTPKTLIKHRKLKAKTGGPILNWSQGFNVY